MTFGERIYGEAPYAEAGGPSWPTGSLAAALPKPTIALSGDYIARETGTLAATLPKLTASLAGTYTAPTVPTGSLDARLPVPVVALSGDYHPHEAGSFALTLPKPTVALAATYADPPWPVGTFDFSLPAPAVALDGTYSGPIPTDTSNALGGLDLLLTARVFITQAVAPVPPSLVPADRYDKAIAYPVPVMDGGRVL